MAWLDETESAKTTRRGVSGRTRRYGNTDVDFRGRVARGTSQLRSSDPVLAALIDRYGPCGLRPQAGYFAVLVEAVISQQLSTRAARAIYRRLVDVSGGRVPRPVDVLGIPKETLIDIGFSGSKAQYIKNAAEAFRSGRMGPKTFARMTDEEVIGYLTSIKGIGEWSAHMFLIFALGRLDVFPVGDLGLRNAMNRAYAVRRRPSPSWYRRVGDRWRPYRTIGTWYLWESYDNR